MSVDNFNYDLSKKINNYTFSKKNINNCIVFVPNSYLYSI